MVIEGTLALTGQFFITDYMEKHDLFPGFTEGFRKIAQDEHRHVAYGTWYLQRAARDPALKQRIQAKLMELIPVAAGVLVPPGADPEHFEILGYSSEETNAFAFTALSRRLKVIGIDLGAAVDRKSTRLNSSHANISYAVFCLKKLKNPRWIATTPVPLTSILHL